MSYNLTLKMVAIKSVVVIVLLLIIKEGQCRKVVVEDMTIDKAKARIQADLILKLHNDAGEIQLKNSYNMVRMYTLFSQEQAQQVVEYIEQHSNLTQAENLSLRMANNGTTSISDCIIRGEIALLQAYRNTWYNVQNCIRSTQLAYEKLYEQLNKKIDLFKVTCTSAAKEFFQQLDRCRDQECLIQTLVRAIVRYEALKAELESEVMEGNNLNSRYIVKGVAMGCVSQSFTQISANYNVGKNISANCFNQPQTTGQTPIQGVTSRH